ncbi:MAG: TraR/DksA family transcriptional regulator [Bacteriovoracaceae bacterium]|nr:TraR/DksA family transcriptional regulator [Bacteriovoracaceae bacterium]
MAKKATGLTKKEFDTLVEKLEAEKIKLMTSQSLKVDEFNIQTEDRSDQVDQANADFSAASQLRFKNREVFYARKVQKALERVAEKTYGLCEECEEPIKFERLLARPTAELCISCKEDAERNEGSSYMRKKSKSMGDSINLVNYI